MKLNDYSLSMLAPQTRRLARFATVPRLYNWRINHARRLRARLARIPALAVELEQADLSPRAWGEIQ